MTKHLSHMKITQHKILCWLILPLFFLFLPLANAQICTKSVTPQTMSSGNFDLTAFGKAEHKLSGLIWDRCVYGQVWDGLTCVGSPIKLTWGEALEVAMDNNKRLPDLKELNTILDLQCMIPPTDLSIFPNTPGSFDDKGATTNGLWSSTPYITTETEKTSAWFIDLGFGSTNYRKVDTLNYARFLNN